MQVFQSFMSSPRRKLMYDILLVINSVYCSTLQIRRCKGWNWKSFTAFPYCLRCNRWKFWCHITESSSGGY